MAARKQWVLLLITLLLGLPMAAGAQQFAGSLSVGQPAANALAAGDSILYSYVLAERSSVTFQVFGDTVQPTLIIRRDGTVVFEETNASGVSILTHTVLLDAGGYEVEVGGANNTAGTVVVLVQGEVPVTPEPLLPDAPVTGTLTPQSGLALYTFGAGTTPMQLIYESGLGDRGAVVELTNAETGQVIGTIGAELLGGSFRISAAAAQYQVKIAHSGAPGAELYTLCLVAVRAGSCSDGPSPSPGALPTQVIPPPVETVEVVAEPQATVCTVTPQGPSANIRQSATTSSIIVGALTTGAQATVLGISPTRDFYNIQYNAISGWVALSVVTGSGPCASVPMVNPPPVIAPTAPPTQPPPPTQPAPPTADGPCLITMLAEALVYSQPMADASVIYDEVQPGYQLIPIGRLADNSWWKTNYANAWIQTSLFGGAANVTGNCSNLPVVSS
ncbi:MAG: SH3 domain-containing protein [Chloroflexi bacterium]|nr:SH3 domain-containing protein [Chloroflexota bacterium]